MYHIAYYPLSSSTSKIYNAIYDILPVLNRSRHHYLNLQKIEMFSTPQSKAYLSQEATKNKLVAEESTLMLEIRDDLFKIKSLAAESLRFLNANVSQDVDEKTLDQISKNIQSIEKLIEEMEYTILESNQMFSLEVSLRDQIKCLEQEFFKSVMIGYEGKIKELKQYLFVIEEYIQQLEQQGYYPYIEKIQPNSVLLTKCKYLKSWIKGRQVLISTLNSSLQELKSLLQSQTIQKMLDLIHQISQIKRNEDKTQVWQQSVIKILENKLICQKIKNFKILEKKRGVSSNLQLYNETNKNLKQQIKCCKRTIKHEKNEGLVRRQQINFTRQQSIDFLHEINENLINKFKTRNVFLILSLDREIPRSKSLPSLKNSISLNHLQTERMETNQQDQNRQVFQDIGNQLTDSFLDQCSYLISDRFIDEEEQTEQIAV